MATRVYTDREKQVLYNIGIFFDSVDALDTLRRANISDLTETDGVVTITLSSPGFFIGLKGNLITALRESLAIGLEFDIKELTLVENKINMYLFPSYLLSNNTIAIS